MPQPPATTARSLEVRQIVRRSIPARHHSWIEDAACSGRSQTERDWWFAYPGSRPAKRAIAICRTCPVRTQCLDDALRHEGGASRTRRFGIYGALTPLERTRHELQLLHQTGHSDLAAAINSARHSGTQKRRTT